MSDIVIAAIIEGSSNILMAIIPAIALLLGGREYLKSKKTREDLQTALKDIQFLLAVESEHIRIHKEHGLPALKRSARCVAGAHFDWSGRFTSARIKNKLRVLEIQDRKVNGITRKIGR